jgi:hypothetical protein
MWKKNKEEEEEEKEKDEKEEEKVERRRRERGEGGEELIWLFPLERACLCHGPHPTVVDYSSPLPVFM